MSLALTTFKIFLQLATLPSTSKQVDRLVRGALDWWAGKKIAVIGPTASGKDSFLARLQGREIPKVHSNSPMGEKIKAFKVKLILSHRQVIDITCKGMVNIGGESDYRDTPLGWLSVCQDANVVFYVMTINDLKAKRYLRGRRIRQDLDWLITALPYLKRNALIHILINKIDQEIESHTDYEALADELGQQLKAFDRTVLAVLHPYGSRYTGATLISMKSKQIYTRAISSALGAVYSALHATPTKRKRSA